VRVDALYPKVSSISNYIVQLIQLDMEKGLIGPIAKKGHKSPFETPLTPFKSNALDGLVLA